MIIILTATDRHGRRVARREVKAATYTGCYKERLAIFTDFAAMRPDGFPPYVFCDIKGGEGYTENT